MNRQTRREVFESIYGNSGQCYKDLTSVRFKPGHEPQEATDYYYNTNTRKYFSYHWGGGEPGEWEDDVPIIKDDIEDPIVALRCSLF